MITSCILVTTNDCNRHMSREAPVCVGFQFSITNSTDYSFFYSTYNYFDLWAKGHFTFMAVPYKIRKIEIEVNCNVKFVN